MKDLQRIQLFVGVTIAFHFTVALPLWGVDCNNNGIDDAQELANCPPIDLVFLMDTSVSMGPHIPGLCQAISDPVNGMLEVEQRQP